MQRSFLTPLTIFALLAPSLTSAYYDTPSDLLRAVEFDGAPRHFTTEAHARIDSMYFSAWVNGSAEGNAPHVLKAKFNATVDINDQGGTMRSRFEAIIHEEVVYMRLKSLEGEAVAGQSRPDIEAMVGQWVKIPADPNSLGSAQDFAALNSLANQAAGGNMFTVQELSDVGKSMIDAVVNMQKDRYPSGFAFNLTLKPDFMAHVARVLAGIAGNAGGVSPELIASDAKLGDKVKLNMKVDTNLQGDFQYGIFSFSADIPEMNTNFRMEGKTTLQDSHVYVEVPTDTMSVETLATLLNAINPSTLSIQPVRLDFGTATTMPTSRSSGHARRVSQPMSTSMPAYNDARCASVGSTELTSLIRKGLCPRVRNTRPGRGGLRNRVPVPFRGGTRLLGR